jgi:hypothetical protein
MTYEEAEKLSAAVLAAFRKASPHPTIGISQKPLEGGKEWALSLRPRQPLTAEQDQTVHDEAKTLLKRDLRQDELDIRVARVRMH